MKNQRTNKLRIDSESGARERGLSRELFGLFCLFCAALLIISLWSHDIRDPGLNHVTGKTPEIRNWAGEFGARLSAGMSDIIGFGSYALVLFFLVLGLRLSFKKAAWPWWRWTGFAILSLCLATLGQAWGIGIAQIKGGGLVGTMLHGFCVGFFSSIGSAFIWCFLTLLTLQMLFGYSWTGVFGLVSGFVGGKLNQLKEDRSKKPAVDFNADFMPEPVPASGPKKASQAKPVKPDFFDGLTSAKKAEPEPRQNRLDVDLDFARPAQPKKSAPVNPEFFDKVIVEPPRSQAAPVPAPPAKAEPWPEPRAEAKAPARTEPARTEPARTEPDGEAAGLADCLKPQPKKASFLSKLCFWRKNYERPAWMDDLEQGRIGGTNLSDLPEDYFSNPSAYDDDDDFLFTDPADEAPAASSKPVKKAEADEATARAAAPVKPAHQTAQAGGAPKAPAALPDLEQALKPGQPSDGLASMLDGVKIDKTYSADPAPAKAPETPQPKGKRRPSPLPSADLLSPAEAGNSGIAREELESKGRALMNTLGDFSVQAELVRITPGPVVTSFEIRPAPGVKSSRISSLSDDLAMGLKAVAVRIQAPIPGTDTVGIEIPNEKREIVGLRELICSGAFKDSKSLLTMAIGKDSSGVPHTADLAKMPHMLVAGATGTGKSVFLNSVLMSFLYKARPDEVKLLLIDPKRIEMAVYADIPHLVHPIVTDMALAKNALDWAVAEMERRYNDIARLGVRNVLSYNEKLREMGDNRPQELADLEVMPYLVLIIDELADLMLTSGKEVETSIVRLAQLARAAGIHLIIATQRPSVDVVTGLIKANFPCRISFQVTSKHDSRTILDTVGAEHLLGRGDMLFKPAGGRFQRLHGAFVRDEDVAKVADYWRGREAPNYRIDFNEMEDSGLGGASGNGASGSEDSMYSEAVDFVRQQGKASISLIQRRFRIGFNRAARYIEQMEQDGIIGPADGSKPRQVR